METLFYDKTYANDDERTPYKRLRQRIKGRPMRPGGRFPMIVSACGISSSLKLVTANIAMWLVNAKSGDVADLHTFECKARGATVVRTALKEVCDAGNLVPSAG